MDEGPSDRHFAGAITLVPALDQDRRRVRGDEFHLTHEFLGFMLGSRRASVSEVLAELNKANVVRSHRGDIEIIDPAGLHRLSCECYDVSTEAMNAVGPTPRR